MKNNLNFNPLPTTFFDKILVLVIMLIAITMLLLLLIADEKKKDIQTKAEYIIQVDWPNGNDDVDVWVLLPTNNTVSYQNKNVNLVNLERDDLGYRSDRIVVNDNVVNVNYNQEIVAFRTILPGEYVVNMHMYRSKESILYLEPLREPVPVEIVIQKINPTLRVVFKGKIFLKHNKEEVHVVRFEILPDGNITNIRTDEPQSIITTGGEILDDLSTIPVEDN